jgi:transposase
MIALPTHGRVYLACGSTDMRRGFDGLAVMVQEVLMQDPHSGALFAFRGKRGDLIKLSIRFQSRPLFASKCDPFLDEGVSSLSG